MKLFVYGEDGRVLVEKRWRIEQIRQDSPWLEAIQTIVNREGRDWEEAHDSGVVMSMAADHSPKEGEADGKHYTRTD